MIRTIYRLIIQSVYKFVKFAHSIYVIKLLWRKQSKMKTSGIVRRIDELGRIVLPMEMRRTLKIREGDSLEIRSSEEGILLQKYSMAENSISVCSSVAKSLGDAYGLPVVVFDNDKVLACANLPKKDWIGKLISQELYVAVSSRKPIIKSDASRLITLTNPAVETIIPFVSQLIVPIINSGDLYGGICLLSKESDKYILGEPDLKCVIATSNIMSDII